MSKQILALIAVSHPVVGQFWSIGAEIDSNLFCGIIGILYLNITALTDQTTSKPLTTTQRTSTKGKVKTNEETMETKQHLTAHTYQELKVDFLDWLAPINVQRHGLVYTKQLQVPGHLVFKSDTVRSIQINNYLYAKTNPGINSN